MDELPSESSLEFDGELLVPQINFIVYRQIFGLEGWFRRICLAAWMANYGAKWIEEIDAGLRRSLTARVARNQDRLYLGAESHDDLIWQTTHSELLRLLVADSVADTVQFLTGANPRFLEGKLNEVREIRNILAHNRALSRRTHVILSGLLASLENAVDTFKARTLYGDSEILDESDELGALLAEEMQANDWSRFQAFVARLNRFIEYVCLPVRRNRDWPDAALLLHKFRDHLDGITAFGINKQGSEFKILVPAVLSLDAHVGLCATFAKNPDVWTDLPFEEQLPRFVCSPKIWFYENRAPFQAELY